MLSLVRSVVIGNTEALIFGVSLSENIYEKWLIWKLRCVRTPKKNFTSRVFVVDMTLFICTVYALL